MVTGCKLRIVLANGSLASYPQGGGHWTVFLQHLFGLKALGHDVFWLELLQTTGDKERDRKLIRIFLTRFRYYGFGERCALLLVGRDLSRATLDSAEIHGTSKTKVKEIIRSANLVWNFCCTLRHPFLSLFHRRALIDLDPGIIQNPEWRRDFAIDEHEYLFTVGSKMGEPDCQVPTLNRTWHRIMPFVYLPAWKTAPDPGDRAPFTTVTQWTWGEISLHQKVFSTSKRFAFLRYVDLPERTKRPFELAANMPRTDSTGDRRYLSRKGWRVARPHRVARSPSLYKNYIIKSRAEFSCSKPIYSELKTGWFSDRSACYLASGRPVLAEDTGFSEHLPTGRGLLSFKCLDEAIAGVREIDRDYERHMRAARELAEEYLSAEKWLPTMLSLCGC